jgi:hypothetical protein
VCGRIHCDCTFEGVELWGKVEVVDAFGDFKIREASFADLKVRDTSFPARCGEWDMVDAFGDFTVEFVTIGEDFTIEYDSFPGLGHPP